MALLTMATSIHTQSNVIEIVNYNELLKDIVVNDLVLKLAHLGGVRGHPLYERIYYKNGDEIPSDAFYEEADGMLMFLIDDVDMLDRAAKSFMVILARLLSQHRRGGKPVLFIPHDGEMSLY